MHVSSQKNTGVISITALVFIAVFVMVLTGLLTTVISQKKVQTAKQQGDQALKIAEAGLDYYKWFLAHFPNDMQDGTGVAGPYIHDYADPEATSTGKFSLVVNGKYQCGSLSQVKITSTGWVNENPNITKVVAGTYGRPTIGEYSYILDSDIWTDTTATGPLHSNGGIHKDGFNFAQVTSAKTTWNCASSYGCSPAQPAAPGVFGSGPNFNLWSWPVPIVDFAAITMNLGDMKNKTASTTPGVCTGGQTYGCYFAPSGGSNRGYHAVFLPDGRMELYRVTATRNTWELDTSTNTAVWFSNESLILAQTPVAGSPFTLPMDCPMVFVEDKLWVDGTVKGKISIAAANLGATDPDLILSGNLEYTTLSGSDGLLAIGEKNVFIPLDSPNDMTIRGIFVAQKGYFNRNCFRQALSGFSGCSAFGSCNNGANNFCRVPVAAPPPGSFCAGNYRNCVRRNSLNVYGTIVSKTRVSMPYVTGGSPPPVISGYLTQTDNYDSKIANDPPPLTPTISDTYKFLKWSQDK